MFTRAEGMAPTPESDDEIAKAIGDIKGKHPDYKGWLYNYLESNKTRLAFDLDHVKAFAGRDKTIIDVAAAPFVLPIALQRLGYDVSAIDIDPSRFRDLIASVGLRVVRCNIEEQPVPFPEDSFDTVIFNEIFEHLRINPVFTLRELHRILKPGGTLLLSTPNLRSLNGIYNFLVKGKSFSCVSSIYEEYEKLSKIGHMGHVREYTCREVTELIERIGFSCRGVVYRGRFRKPVTNAIGRLRPDLRPYMMLVAAK